MKRAVIVPAALGEQSEAYRVTLGDPLAPVALWELAEPRLTIAPELAIALAAQAPGAAFAVSQRGNRGLSAALPLGPLP